MSRCPQLGGAPVAAPFASSHERRAPLWDGAFRRITPGALSAVRVLLLFPAGGRT
jgi:hypothetical protein